MSGKRILEEGYVGQMLWSHLSSMKGSLNESMLSRFHDQQKDPQASPESLGSAESTKNQSELFSNYSANLIKIY